jgi:hypothetical protein
MHTFYFKPTQGYGFQVVGIKTTKLPWNPALGSRMAALDIISLVDAGHTVVIYPEKRTKDSNPDLPRELHLTPEYKAKIKAKKAPQTPATPPELEPFFQFLESTPRKWFLLDGYGICGGDKVESAFLTFNDWAVDREMYRRYNKVILTATWERNGHPEYSAAVRGRLLKSCGIV